MINQFKMKYISKPVLILLYNRPDKTEKLLKAIENFNFKTVYISSDGPKNNNTDKELVKRVREKAYLYAENNNCKFLKNEENKGCKYGVSSAINWFFENENDGIILEDDCIPGNDFFFFCEEMLNHFNDDESIYMITGDNFQPERKVIEPASYYYSKYPHVWGWATWKRSWVNYDIDMKSWKKFKSSAAFKKINPNFFERRYWTKIFDQTFYKRIDTWDYQWAYTIWLNAGKVVTPVANLVENIGFGKDATHTKETPYKINPINDGVIGGVIIHTHDSKINKKADKFIFVNVLGGIDIFSIRGLLKLFKQSLSFLK